MRNQLIDAAVRVLLDDGPAALTSRRVLDAAGLSAGALYHYFSSLDELSVAIAERFTELELPWYEPPVDGDGADQAAALSNAHVAIMSDLFGPGPHTLLGQLRVISMSKAGVQAALGRYDEVTVARAGALNALTQEVGLFRSDLDGEVLAELIMIFFEDFATRAATTGFTTSRERVLRLFLEMLADRVLETGHRGASELRTRFEAIAAGPRATNPGGTRS